MKGLPEAAKTAALYAYLLAAAIAAMYAAGVLVDWLDAAAYKDPSDAGLCGPHHHWKYIQTGTDLEKSCEPD